MAYLENSGGYESMVWVNDRHGRKFTCYRTDIKNFTILEDMPEELREKCFDVNSLVGTERW
jgi:hypothetical protein